MNQKYNPLVSIVIPVYNGSNYVKEAIESALTQTYKNIEIIVVNDGSKDNGATEQVVWEFGDRVRYFHKENGGVSTALNFGIDQMRGDYFSWLSHDDLYEPDKVEKEVAAINNPGDLILCSGYMVDENKNPISYRVKTLSGNMGGHDLFQHFLHGYALNGLGFLVPRSLFKKVGNFDVSMRYLQDLDLWLRMLIYDVPVVCLRDKLVVTRLHKEQQTNTIAPQFDVDREKLAVKHLALIEQDNHIPGKKRLLLMYLQLFVKGQNVVGVQLAKLSLTQLGVSKANVFIKSLPFYAIGLLINLKRFFYNIYLKIIGER